MLKNLSTALAISTALTTGVTAATVHDFSMTEANRQAAATFAAHANSRTNSEQNRWWDDFTTSGKNVVDHVADISLSNPKAAMWFLLTGGRDGFSDREATPEERAKLEMAMKNVAIEVYKSSRTAGAEMWKDLTEKYNQGHAHVQMLHKEVADLKELVRTQGLDITRLNGVVANQSARIAAHEATISMQVSRITSLENSLADEKRERRADVNRLEEKLVAAEKLRREEAAAAEIRIKDSVAQALAAFKEQAREERLERERMFAAFMNPQARIDLSSLLVQLNEKSLELEATTRAKVQALQEKDVFQAQLMAARDQIGVLQATIQTKENELRALGQNNQVMADQIRLEKQRLAEAQASIEHLEREAAQQRQRTAEEKRRDREELERAQRTIEDLRRELGLTRQKLGQATGQLVFTNGGYINF